jgi:hypothetical protein
LAFQSNTDLAGFQTNGFDQVYLYDSQTDSLTCASCRSDGEASSSDASLGDPEDGGSNFNHHFPESVLDDGSVFFSTSDPLLAADVNATRDVYAFHDDRVSLISRGKLATTSFFLEATPDGSDVFFLTDDRLVSQDQDNVADVYDARVGGGIAAQNVVPTPPCSGEGCRGATGPLSPPLVPGSEAVTGPGNRSQRVGKHCTGNRHKKRVKGKTRCVRQKAPPRHSKTDRRHAR